MKNRTLVFVAGCVAGIIVLVGGGFLYARLGLVNPRADIPVPSVEAGTAMKFLDASVATAILRIRKARLRNLSTCGLHNFQKEKPDMPENQNFYLIKHGIRYSGMPAWERSMTDEQTWEVVAFLSHMDKLSAALQE